MITVQLFKFSEEVPTPKYGTSMSACFDLSFFPTGPSVKGYDYQNDEVDRFMWGNDLSIHPGDRLLVPTGLIMKIIDPYTQYPPTVRVFPEPKPTDVQKYSIRLHARSGLSFKKGLILANSEGVVDADYQQEIFVMLTNISGIKQKIMKGERIAQAEIAQQCVAKFELVYDVPTQHSERDGGFGSTGV